MASSSLSPPCLQVSPYVFLRRGINVHSPPLLPFSSTHIHAHILRCTATGNHSTTKLAGAIGEEERKREVLERYGLDPSEFGFTSSKRVGRRSRNRERDEVERRGKEADVLPPEKPKPPRTTHRLLHVLGGKVRRKKLLSPKGMDVRPMMELVRGAAFDILQVAGGCPASLRPGRWLDLYSGTGSVGIEALSRGCTEAHFVEMDPWVVSEVLRPNLQWTGFMDVSSIHMIPVENFLQNTQNSLGGDGSFDYISVTPPYIVVDYSMLMNQLENSPLVGENTFILVEYPIRTMMPESCGLLVKIADRRFGRTQLAIYGPNWAQKKKRSKTSKRKEALT